MLDTFFGGSAYTALGPFLGLISAASFSAIVAGDTMASHAGWLEAGSANLPTYTGTRPTMIFNPASGGVKTLSPNAVFTITSGGTIKGGFVCAGPSATNAVDGTAGCLWSAGLFVDGDNGCNPGDVVNVTYATAL